MLIDYDSTFDKIQQLYKNSGGEAHKAYSKCLDAIADMPTVDAKPVKRGGIAHDKLTHYYFCQDCLFQIEESDIPYYNFCPHCGAKFSKN